jgi:hypothetical protein
MARSGVGKLSTIADGGIDQKVFSDDPGALRA